MRRFSGQKLREARGKRNQTDLAAALQRRGFGTTQTQISRWESGQTPRAYILAPLADALGVKLDDLLEDDPADDAPFQVDAA